MTLIIAEMRGSHNYFWNQAFAIVDVAAIAGVDAMKLQTYTANTMMLDIYEGELFISCKRRLLKGESLNSL